MFFIRKSLNTLKTKSRLLQKLPFKFKQPITTMRFNFCDLNRINISKFLESKPVEKEVKSEKLQQSYDKESFVIEFTNEIDWETSVIKSEIPVVVDCYADWCSPCKKLLPILLEKVESQQNFKLVKINIDKNEDLVAKMGIESVPTVFLVFKGNVVDSFTGLPNEKRLNEFFSSIDLLKRIGEDDEIMRSLLRGADEWMNKKQWDQAENMFHEAMSYEKWRNKYGAIIKLGLGKDYILNIAICAYNKNNYDLSEKLIKELNEKWEKDLKADEDIRKRVSNLEIKVMSRKNPDLVLKSLENLENDINENPQNLETRYNLALQYFENSEFEKCIDSLLEIIKIDRNWNNKAANNFLLKIFNFLGSNNKLTQEGRKKLSKVLF